MSDDEYRPGMFRPPSQKPLGRAVAEQRWLDNIERSIERWTQHAAQISVEDWQRAMTARAPRLSDAQPRHRKIPLRRRLALKWSGWTFRHIWNHCPRYHEDDD